MSHLAEIYRLFSRRITARLSFLMRHIGRCVLIKCKLYHELIRYIQVLRVVLFKSLMRCALVARNALEK